MKLLLFLSDTIIPLLIFYIIGTGLLQKQNIYEEFIHGAEDGFRTVIKIMPTLIGLMVAVGILRASGLLDAVSSVFGNLIGNRFIPGEIIPVFIVRLFSNSAATGLVLDIFKKYGTDSLLGCICSIMMSSTETVFYTMSVYFMSVKIKKTRWTLTGAMLAAMAGAIASIILAEKM
ncbi:Spore maturation protein B [Eubacterium plexicaudatum ASF492]|uniref:Nucleoside transporter/FeoB GTPase Gate domain-containing protein n=1 Tax=Eubacterium plexicaudatum ASF492 TaxID=1235802 RepID=N2BAP0_9FIRM|nr:Spore maturation protein B [Eubacterium plexicaudatum ASF492]